MLIVRRFLGIPWPLLSVMCHHVIINNYQATKVGPHGAQQTRSILDEDN